MSWINITKAKLVEGECYSIRAVRSKGNMKIFPLMARPSPRPAKGNYIINCVRFERRIRTPFGPEGLFGEVNQAGGILEFDYIDPAWDEDEDEDEDEPLHQGRITLLYAKNKGIQIKHIQCSAKDRAASTIKSKFRGDRSRLKSKAEGRITKKQFESGWAPLERQIRATGDEIGMDLSEEIKEFRDKTYMRADKKKSKKRRISNKKKKRKSKGKKTKRRKSKRKKS